MKFIKSITHVLSYLLVACATLATSAAEILDTAKFEVIYTHIAYDSILDKKQITDEMLSIGSRIQYYSGYGEYQTDSLYQHDENFRKLPIAKKQFFTRKYDTIGKRLFIDPENNIMEYLGYLFGEGVSYQEPIADFTWTLLEGTEEILGYSCQIT